MAHVTPKRSNLKEPGGGYETLDISAFSPKRQARVRRLTSLTAKSTLHPKKFAPEVFEGGKNFYEGRLEKKLGQPLSENFLTWANTPRGRRKQLKFAGNTGYIPVRRKQS